MDYLSPTETYNNPGSLSHYYWTHAGNHQNASGSRDANHHPTKPKILYPTDLILRALASPRHRTDDRSSIMTALLFRSPAPALPYIT